MCSPWPRRRCAQASASSTASARSPSSVSAARPVTATAMTTTMRTHDCSDDGSNEQQSSRAMTAAAAAAMTTRPTHASLRRRTLQRSTAVAGSRAPRMTTAAAAAAMAARPPHVPLRRCTLQQPPGPRSFSADEAPCRRITQRQRGAAFACFPHVWREDHAPTAASSPLALQPPPPPTYTRPRRRDGAAAAAAMATALAIAHREGGGTYTRDARHVVVLRARVAAEQYLRDGANVESADGASAATMEPHSINHVAAVLRDATQHCCTR